MIPFLSFASRNKDIKNEILTVFESFFDSESYVLGRCTSEFEQNYAKFSEAAYCVGVGNGLDALQLALVSLGIGSGDEVIIPSNTYIATVLAVSYVGATPIFVEPNINTFNINPNLIENAITPKTKAILPVHLYGQACEMDKIMIIAQKYKLWVIEDNAQAHLATFQGKKTGSFGDINATSFYPSKNLGAFGEGGAITTNNLNLYNKCKMLRNYGSKERYYNELIGFNKRIDECQAAFLNVSLGYLNKWTEERKRIAAWYDYYLSGIKGITLPIVEKGASHVYHLYVIRTPKREQLQRYLSSKNISTLIHYPIPPHLQLAYKHLGYKKGDFLIAEELADTCLSLPIFLGMEEWQVKHVAHEISTFLKNAN